MSGTITSIPVLTTAQATALAVKPTNFIYYDTTLNSLRKWNGAAFVYALPSQYIEGTFPMAAWPFASADFGDLTSILLPVGTWDLSLLIYTNNNGVVTTTSIDYGVSTFPGNDSSGLVLGSNLIELAPVLLSSGAKNSSSIPDYVVTVTTPTTYYFKGQAVNVTNLQASGRLSAVQLAI